MQKFEHNVTDARGNAVVGATISVVTSPGGTPAAIYLDNGSTLISGNSVTSGPNGYYSFYAANGRYSRTISGPRLTPTTYSDFELYDRADDTTFVSPTGTTLIRGTWFGGVVAYLSALGTSAGAALTGFIQAGANAVARSIQAELRDTVSVKQFGAVGDGVADDTAAIQKALDFGTASVKVPTGTYRCSALLMPTTPYFTLYGEGPGSMFKQNGGGVKVLTWDTAANAYNNQTVRDLGFDGTNGAANIINTAGAGGLTLENIYIKNVPTGFTGIFVNGAAATYVHDVRITGLQIYSSTAGHSGVRFGPLASDTSVTGFIMNGQFAVQYPMYYDIGAVTIRVSDSHPYNAAVNVICLAGNNDDCAFDNVVLDNATNDVFSASNCARLSFTAVWLEAIKSGYSGMKFVSCTAVSAYNCRFDGAAGAAACVTADSGCTDMRIIGGNLGTLANYVTPFSLAGARSYATAIAGYNPLGLTYSFSGATTAVQAQNTTQYLGVNGGQAAINNTYYLAPEAGTIDKFRVEVASTPAAGQTFTFNLQKNGSTIGTITLNNGDFSGAATVNTSVAQYDTVAIQSVFSATSGSSNIRYSVRFKA